MTMMIFVGKCECSAERFRPSNRHLMTKNGMPGESTGCVKKFDGNKVVGLICW